MVVILLHRSRCIFHYWQSCFLQCFAQVICCICIFREYNKFTIRVALHLLFYDFNKRVKFWVKADCIVFVKPLLAKILKKLNVGLYIVNKFIFDIFHIYLKESFCFVFLEDLFYFLPIIIRSIIKITYVRKITFLVNWNLMSFINPFQNMLR